uniref:Uncharacterized protein n=1 Tax=Kalanchoe fedtschenkoi TaxID=63787 RepID=A0A7N0UIE5_KALFE
MAESDDQPHKPNNPAAAAVNAVTTLGGGGGVDAVAAEGGTRGWWTWSGRTCGWRRWSGSGRTLVVAPPDPQIGYGGGDVEDAGGGDGPGGSGWLHRRIHKSTTEAAMLRTRVAEMEREGVRVKETSEEGGQEDRDDGG